MPTSFRYLRWMVLPGIFLGALNTFAGVEEENPDEFEGHHSPHSQQITIETDQQEEVEALMAEDDYLTKMLSEISGKDQSYSLTVDALYLSLAPVGSGPLKVRNVVKVICKSYLVSRQYKVALMDADAVRSKTAIDESNRVYAGSVCLVVVKTEHPDSPEGEAIARLIWCGEQNARGQRTLRDIKDSTRLMAEITRHLELKLQYTSESSLAPSLADAWPAMSGDERAKRARELLDWNPPKK